MSISSIQKISQFNVKAHQFTSQSKIYESVCFSFIPPSLLCVTCHFENLVITGRSANVVYGVQNSTRAPAVNSKTTEKTSLQLHIYYTERVWRLYKLTASMKNLFKIRQNPTKTDKLPLATNFVTSKHIFNTSDLLLSG